MKGMPRGVFDRAVQASGAERYHKCFSSWNHLTAMVVGHLSGATSLRTLERTYNSQTHQHYHLGTGPLRRSTLADANAKRSMAPFEAVAQALMAQAHRTLRREGQALLYLLDSTPIPLAGRHFDAWTQANRTQRTQGLKLHLLIAQPGGCSAPSAQPTSTTSPTASRYPSRRAPPTCSTRVTAISAGGPPSTRRALAS